MKNFKKTLCGLLFGLVGFGAVAATVSDVKARQRYPWNGKIDIDYTITGADTTNTALAVTLTDHDTGKVYSLTERGRHQFTWNRRDLAVSNGAATVSLVRYSVFYCVIDLSGGPNAARWPVSYLSAVPSNGWTDEYKTTKLVLRQIPAGTFIMGDDQTDESHRVTLTKPFYMGVFEVTQKQWELVMGLWPGSCPSSSYGRGDAYPAYYVSYNDISNFLGRLRAKTGLDFDLPTEAQWEYACRAGTTTFFYWGEAKVGAYAWHGYNSGLYGSGGKAHPVGTKLPNAWGLYDMGGNVLEWCRDWYGTLAYGTDPVDLSWGWSRVQRGGSWSLVVECCASSDRGHLDPSNRDISSGFRLVMALSD